MLSARNISIAYGPCEVLREITFDIAEGTVTALLGPNGAGKTTLLKALNGTLATTKGSVQLGGRDLHEFSRREIAQQIAVVAQENETKFPVTVREFVLAGRFASGSAFGWESVDDVRAADAALEQCDLAGFADRMMNELSGGERQRVVLARALATEARILLLDEPTANLDLAHQAMMFRLVRERCREMGYAAVVITHDLNLAAEFADNILMLCVGQIFAAGEPAEVLNEANIFDVYGVRSLLDANPVTSKPRVTAIY